MFERILIATDGSKHSEKAAEMAVEMAGLYGSKITALYVVDIGKEYASLGDLISKVSDDLIAGIRGNLQDQGERATEVVLEMAEKAGIPSTSRISEGYPAEDIVRIAEDEDAGLIVMGGMGATGLDRFLLGSVADRVVRSSRIPVLVVKKEQAR
ncbi:MAG: universal stress protein [Methanothrix sp.]|jgi:nucleotide-binding universal stress UspA family protein|nr:universal stress protein [Methanothrix sp.]